MSIMKIVIAPDSFKGSMTAEEVANALHAGFRRVGEWEILRIPVADGGEGTVQALVDATGGEVLEAEVTGPLGEPVRAAFGLLGDGETCVIEMAQASGLPLLPLKLRNPLLTTTFGTGELIRAGLLRGCRKFIIGIGGSATNDGGMGMAQALGVHFLDDAGGELGLGGGELQRLAKIELGGLLAEAEGAEFRVACDVTNPLVGPEGAAAVYGPQKGATPEMVQLLDRGLCHFAEIVARDLGVEIATRPGAGAAGGLGGGLMAFLGAELHPGVEIVLEAVKFREQLRGAGLVITGEGKIDGQTIYGKTPIGVAQVAKSLGIPVIAIAGSLGTGAQTVHDHGIDALFSIVRGPLSLSEAMARGPELVAELGEQIGRMLHIFHN